MPQFGTMVFQLYTLKLTRKMQHYLVWFCMIISMFYTYYLYKPDDVHVSNYKLRDVIQYVDAKHSKAWK